MARKGFIDHDGRIKRLFESVDTLLQEEGGSPPLEPEDMDGDSDPIEPIGDKGEEIASICFEYAEAIDKAKGAHAFLQGIGSWSDKDEVKVLVAKAKKNANEGLKALQAVVAKLDKL